MQKLLKAISFLELHRGYEGSSKALEQARQVLTQAHTKCKSEFVHDVALLSRYDNESSPSFVATSFTDDLSSSSSAAAAAAEAPLQPTSRLKAERDVFDTAQSMAPHPITTKESNHDMKKASDLLKCILSTNLPPTQLLQEYGEKRWKLAKEYLCQHQHLDQWSHDHYSSSIVHHPLRYHMCIPTSVV
jgi:hypothetical protein